VAALVWCVVNRTLSVSWEDDRAPVTSGQVTIEALHLAPPVASHATSLGPADEPEVAAPGAVLILVWLDFRLDIDALPENAAAGYRCSMELVGDGRSWQTSTWVSDWAIIPDKIYDCGGTDYDGRLIGAGTRQEVFEVPADAVHEITGVRVRVEPYRDITEIDVDFTDSSQWHQYVVMPVEVG
jgi:hypothetical protein